MIQSDYVSLKQAEKLSELGCPQDGGQYPLYWNIYGGEVTLSPFTPDGHHIPNDAKSYRAQTLLRALDWCADRGYPYHVSRVRLTSQALCLCAELVTTLTPDSPSALLDVILEHMLVTRELGPK